MSTVERARYAIREVFGPQSEADEKRLCLQLAGLLRDSERREIARWCAGFGSVLGDMFGMGL